MNVRALLHAASAGFMAIAAGTVVFAGLPEVLTKDVVGLASLAVIVIDTYLASTTTGQNAAASK